MMLQAGTYRGVKGCTAGCVKGCHVHESKPHALAGTQVEGGRVQLRQYGQRWRAVCRCLCFGPLTGANALMPVSVCRRGTPCGCSTASPTLPVVR